ncbi:MAG TPA: recombinase family protein [Trebonia sp.]|nr:recombinase family protein [Trebonia sp.]
MLSGRLAKAERGELAVPLPIGYVRRPSGEAVLDPDEQARHVVRLVFSTFSRQGTINGVLRYLVAHEVQLPVRAHAGPSKGELEWHRPTRETLQNMLHNPVYAGYFAWGRRQVDPRRKAPGRPGTGRVVKDSTQWLVLLPGRLPAYITEEEFQANIARMAANQQTAETAGAPRNGAALLSGLLRCGRCGGHRMSVSYPDSKGRARSVHGYGCSFYQASYGTGGSCQHVSGPALDGYVTSQVLAAVAPAALEVSMTAATQAEGERAMLDRLWRQRVERARHAADRARRQYQLAEPENRLVTRQLEADWEAALAEAGRLEADYQRFAQEQPSALTPAERAAIAALASDIPRVWHAPSTTQADRKELLRILIQDITVNVAGGSEIVNVTITWAGGHQTTGQATRPVGRMDQLSYFPALLARVTELAAAGRTHRQIADTLNAEGFRPPKRTSRFTGEQVRAFIEQRGIPRRHKGRPAVLTSLPPGQWSVPGLAAELGMPVPTIYTWIYRGWITASHAPGSRCWIITADDQQIRELRDRRARPPGYYTRARWNPPEQETSDAQGARPWKNNTA